MNALRTLVLVAISSISFSAISQPATLSANSSNDALSNKKLSVWISADSSSRDRWQTLFNDLKTDYPSVQVDWKFFAKSMFLQALDDAIKRGQPPDVAFTDNYRLQGPMQQRYPGRVMAGLPRHGENGWWTILSTANDPKAAEAFFIWLEQPKNWKPASPVTQLISSADRSTVADIATQTVRAFGDPHPPSDILDHAIGLFSWSTVRIPSMSDVDSSSYTPVVDQIGGNSRLAFVAVSSLQQTERTFGMVHSFLVLRKVESTWKVLLIQPYITWNNMEETLSNFDRIGMTRSATFSVSAVKLLTPVNADYVSRFPRTEIAFQQQGHPGNLVAVESEYSERGNTQWTQLHFTIVNNTADSSGIFRMPAPFGVGMQPHRWRVWSISSAGIVTLSEWRTVNFTN